MAEKWVVVAGASGAIGGAICSAAAADGWGVVAGYRSRETEAKKVVDELTQRGLAATTLALDLSDGPAVADALARTATEKPIHGIVYAAGPKLEMRHLSTIEPQVYARHLQDDAAAFFNLANPAIPILRETQGSIIAVTTTALARYAVKDILSVAPKAAVEATVRGIAAEEGRFGVRANCVGVGVIDSGLWYDLVEQGAYTPEFLDAAKRNIALRRFGTADDIAAAASFLLSPGAKWISGQTLNVDGGYSL